jgi:hypothetical protein
LEGISAIKYADDPDILISVYGYVLYFCGAPIPWKSKAGMSVTLSSTEAEYYATSEITKEVFFAKNLLEFSYNFLSTSSETMLALFIWTTIIATAREPCTLTHNIILFVNG